MTNFRTAKYNPDTVGIDDPNDLQMLTTAQVTAAQALVSGERNFHAGYRAALFADSMTDFNFLVVNPSSVSYAPSTRTLTITSSSFNMPIGSRINFWNRNYASLTAMQHLTVDTYSSATVYSAVLPAGDYSDLPTGALTGTSYAVHYSQKCAKSWLTWLNALLGQRFDVVMNSAQSGDTTTQNLARLSAEMLLWKDAGVSLVVMQSPGVNDITFDSVSGLNDATGIVTRLRTIFDTIRIGGYKILISTISPVETGETKAQKSMMVLIQAVNRWLWKYAQRYADMVVLIDAYDSVVNRTDTTGLAQAGFLNATDHIHYTNVGGYRVAKDATNLARVAAAFPVARSTLPASVLDSRAGSIIPSPTAVVAADGVTVTVTSAGSYIQKNQEVFIRGATGSYTALNVRQVANATIGSGSFMFTSATAVPAGAVTGTLIIATSRQLFPNPLLATATGGSSSGTGMTGTAIAANLACSTVGAGITAVANVSAEPNGYGNEQTISISAATTVGDQVRFAFSASVGTVDNQMQAGRSYILEAQLRLTSSAWANTPISEIDFNLTLTGNGSAETWRVTDVNQYEAVVPLISSGAALTETLHLKTAILTIPAGLSINSAAMNCYIRIQAAFTGSLVVGLSRIAVRDVTNDGMELLV